MDEIGELIDRIESLRGALELPIPPEMHITEMKKRLTEIVEELKVAYIKVTNDNPWEY